MKSGEIIPPPLVKFYNIHHNDKDEVRPWINPLAIVVFLLELVSLLDMFTDLYILV